MPSQFLSAVILLLLVVDPFGNVPLVNAMLADVPLARRRTVIVRECGIAFAVLAAFMAFGPEILAAMHLSESSLSIAGDRKSTRLNSSHLPTSRMPSSA